MSKKNISTFLPLIIAFVGVLIAGGVIYMTQTGGQNQPNNSKKQEGSLTQDQVVEKSLQFINKELLSDQTTASVVKSVKENGLLKIKIDVQGQQIDTYATLDGELFFPQGFNLTEELAALNEEQQPSESNGSESAETPASCKEVTKKEQPLLQAFIVSQCPYGLQMQRILAEVVGSVPSLADNIEVAYMGSVSNGEITAMHGTEEAQENLRQICLREESNKYWDYLSCHIKQGNVDSCLQQAEVNTNNLNACMNDSSRGLAYAKQDFDQQSQHGVTGSPTLIVNGEKASEFSFGGRTADAIKNLLCCGFNQEPGICSETLNQNTAASSYSESYSSGNAPEGGGC